MEEDQKNLSLEKFDSNFERDDQEHLQFQNNFRNFDQNKFKLRKQPRTELEYVDDKEDNIFRQAKISNVLDDFADDPDFLKQQDLDKVEQILDSQKKQNGLTAFQELDAGYSETVKCFSFSAQQQPDSVTKTISFSNHQELAKNSQKYMDSRNSDIIPETINELDDSINMRISNPSEETSGKQAQLFQRISITESEKDGHSAYFRQSPNTYLSRPSTGGFKNDKTQPNFGQHNVESSNEKSQKSSQKGQQLVHKLQRQNLIISPKVKPAKAEYSDRLSLIHKVPPRDSFANNEFFDKDDCDVEASPINPLGKKMQIQIAQQNQRYTPGNLDRDTDLDTSMIEVEGQILSDPMINSLNNTLAGPIGGRQDSGLSGNALKKNFAIQNSQQSSDQSQNALMNPQKQQSDVLKQQPINPDLNKKNIRRIKVLNGNINQQGVTKISKSAIKTSMKSPDNQRTVIKPQGIQSFTQILKQRKRNGSISAYKSQSPINSDILSFKQAYITQNHNFDHSQQKGPGEDFKSPEQQRMIQQKIKNNATTSKKVSSNQPNKPQRFKLTLLQGNKDIGDSGKIHKDGNKAYTTSQGASNLNDYTKNADITQMIKKKQIQYNNQQDVNISNFEKQKQDDVLKETPLDTIDNDPIQITSIRHLFSVIGIPFNDQDKSFIVNGQDFKLDMRELGKEFEVQKDFVIKSHRSSRKGALTNGAYSSNGGISEDRGADTKIYINQDELRQTTKTPRPEEAVKSFGLAGIGLHNPMEIIESKSNISLKIQNFSRQSKSPNYLNSNSQLALRLPNQHQFGGFESNQKTNRSGISGMSGLNSVHSKQRRDRSPLVDEHERKAQRMRSQSKKNPLQVDKYMTESANVQQQLGGLSKGKANLSQNQLQTQLMMKMSKEGIKYTHHSGSNGTINTSSQPPSGLIYQQSSNNQTEKEFNPNGRNFAKQKFQTHGIGTGLVEERDDTFDDEDDFERQRSTLVSQNTGVQEKINEKIHLAFLFASPLMLKTSDNKYYDVLPPISFSEEFEQIKASIEDKNIAFNYRYLVATEKHLIKALRENPVGIHFSGHGFQNNESLYQGDKKGWLKYKGKGDVLIFENEDGASDFLFTQNLKEILNDCKKQLQKIKENEPKDLEVDKKEINVGQKEITEEKGEEFTEPQFAFVASCHSEQVGEVFLDAGIPHVICIDQKETILDKAAIEFSKFFYDEVFDQYVNICDAYERAKKKVEDAFGKFQAKKIKLLKNHQECQEQKDERLRPRIGQVREIGENCDILSLPNKVHPFICRNQDMLDVLKSLTENNVVQIFGMPGLGKSSLLRNVTCYLGDRDIYKNGILYIDFRYVTTFKEAIEILEPYFRDYDRNFQSFNQDQFYEEVNLIKAKIFNFQRRFLLTCDNVDKFPKIEHEKFLNFIKDISSPLVKVMFTSTKFSQDIFSDGYVVKKVKKLKKFESYNLFMKKIPLAEKDKEQFFDYDNIKELHQVTIAKYGEDSDFVPKLCVKKHPHTSSCVTQYLQNHPIFEFMGGIPLVISIVAPFCVSKSLSEIFEYLAEKNDEKNEGNLQKKIEQKISEQDLIDSLEYCTNHFLNLKGRGILNLWYQIGLQGPGILYEDLLAIHQAGQEEADKNKKMMQLKIEESLEDIKEEQMTSEQKLDKNLEDLINFSLIEQEALDKAGTIKRYRTSPFVNKYIQTKMPQKMRSELLGIVCTHFQAKLIDLKNEYSREIQKCQNLDDHIKVQNNLLDKIKPYEGQIMHIISLKMKLEDKINDDDSFCTDDEESQDATKADQSMSTQKSMRSKSKGKHQRAVSRDVPTVSNHVKFSRQTFKGHQGLLQLQEQSMPKIGRHDSHHVSKGMKNVRQIYQPEIIRQTPLQSNTTMQDSSMFQPAGEISEVMEQTPETNRTHIQLDFSTSQKDGRPRQNSMGRAEDANSMIQKEDESQFLFSQRDENDQKKKSQKHVVISKRRDTVDDPQYLDFKQSIIADRDFKEAKDSIQETIIDKVQIAIDEQMRMHKLNKQMSPAQFLMERDSSYHQKDLKLENQKTSENQNPFQAAEINKIFNGQQENGDNIDHLCYDQADNESTPFPSVKEISQVKRRQTKMFKNLSRIEYDEHEQGLKQMRMSILDKSLKKGNKHSLQNQLQNFKNNPDLVFNFNSTLEQGKKNKTQLPTVIEEKEISIPLKQNYTEFMSEDQSTLLQLNLHEELYFNFLSILAIIPIKRQELIQILDMKGQRQMKNQEAPESPAQFDLVSQAERRMKKLKTVVDIPEEARLLVANTMMLELYVGIKETQFSLSELNNLKQDQAKNDRSFDLVHEMAEQFKPHFELIHFNRGMAILDYVQARRQLEKFKKIPVFKALLKQSATKFAETHEIEGVQQCITLAKQSLIKSSEASKNNPIHWMSKAEIAQNEGFIKELEQIHDMLSNTNDMDVKNFIKYRQEVKIGALSAEICQIQDATKNAAVVTTDLVLNMLLNPQHQLTINFKQIV